MFEQGISDKIKGEWLTKQKLIVLILFYSIPEILLRIWSINFRCISG